MTLEMYRKGYLVILASLLVSVVNAFGPPQSTNQQPDGGPKGDQHIYQCFTAINCVLADTTDHDRLKECIAIMDKKDEEIALSWLSDEEDVSHLKDKYDVLNITYCVPDKDTRKKKFDRLVQGVLELYSVGCETRYEKTTCDHWEEMTECSTNLMDELDAEGKCDLSSFE